MNWHYSLNKQSHGPVDDPELARLISQGVIKPDTLVWREGMAAWQPYATATSVPPVMAGSGILCSQCGLAFAEDQLIRIENILVCAACKPVVMQKLREGVTVSVSASEQIRKAHLSHEASIRSVGQLYLLGAVFLIPASIISLVSVTGMKDREVSVIFAAFFLLCLGGFQLAVGLGLRKLKSWTRIASGIISGFGLLAIPLGTLINGYILYLLFSKKGSTVFSADYQRVIADTPHIKYRTSILVWIVLGLLVLVVAGGIAAAVMG